MQVHMWHALAHHLVEDEQGARAPERGRLCGGDPSAGAHERPEQALGRFCQARVMGAGHYQCVAVEHGAVVEERHQVALVQDDMRSHLARDDAVEDALLRDPDITLMRYA